jgi:hypothetical protein
VGGRAGECRSSRSSRSSSGASLWHGFGFESASASAVEADDQLPRARGSYQVTARVCAHRTHMAELGARRRAFCTRFYERKRGRSRDMKPALA